MPVTLSHDWNSALHAQAQVLEPNAGDSRNLLGSSTCTNL